MKILLHLSNNIMKDEQEIRFTQNTDRNMRTYQDIQNNRILSVMTSTELINHINLLQILVQLYANEVRATKNTTTTHSVNENIKR